MGTRFTSDSYWYKKEYKKLYGKMVISGREQLQLDDLICWAEDAICKFKLKKKIIIKESDFSTQKDIDKSYKVKHKREMEKTKKIVESLMKESKALRENNKTAKSELESAQKELDEFKKAYDSVVCGDTDLIDLEYILEQSKTERVIRAFNHFQRQPAYRRAKEEAEKIHRQEKHTEGWQLLKGKVASLGDTGFSYKGLSVLTKSEAATLLEEVELQLSDTALKNASEYPVLSSDTEDTPAGFLNSVLCGDMGAATWALANPEKFPQRYAWLVATLTEVSTGRKLGWASHYRIAKNQISNAKSSGKV
jgi:myosin heavy subunit